MKSSTGNLMSGYNDYLWLSSQWNAGFTADGSSSCQILCDLINFAKIICKDADADDITEEEEQLSIKNIQH